MKKIHIAALLVVGLLIGYIATMSSSYTTYETFATAYSNTGKDFQVVGTLDKTQPLQYDPEKDPNYFAFFMKDSNGDVRKVVYSGSKPQDFERSEQIVLTGHSNGDEFLAAKILLKCPSKYIQDKLDDKGYYDIAK